MIPILDQEIFGMTVRTIARVLVFGGIVIILLRKGIRRIRGRKGTPRH